MKHLAGSKTLRHATVRGHASLSQGPAACQRHNGEKIWDVAYYVGMSEEMVRKRYGHHAPDFLKSVRDAL